MYQPTAVGIDIFAGGFTTGVLRAGFDVKCNLEENNFGYATFHANYPNIPVYIGKDTWPVEQLAREDIDFGYANPPCVVFSAAALSKKDTWRQKGELSCTLLTFDTFERMRPAIYAWECVPRAWTMGRELVDAMTDRALALGYSVSYIFNDSVVLGCAQRRRRFMLVAHMVELEPFLPVNPKIWTVDEQLEGVEPDYKPMISSGLAEAFRLQGKTHDLREAWDSLYTKGVDKGRPKMMDHRIDGDRPCSTITGMLSQVHPREDRYLSPNEVAKLCGYPDDYKWVYKPRNATDFQQQCCKAVLPGAGQYISTIAYNGLMQGRLTSNQVKIWDPRKWANWQVARQLDGSTEPEPVVTYSNVGRAGHLGNNEFNPKYVERDEDELLRLNGSSRGGKSAALRQYATAAVAKGEVVAVVSPRGVEYLHPKPEPRPRPVQAALPMSSLGVTMLTRDQVQPASGRSPVVIGFAADGRRIRSRNPQFDENGVAIMQPQGHPRGK